MFVKMPPEIIYIVLFLNVVWRVSANNDDDVRALFQDNITRSDFANLLQSLIKLNEQRVNVLQKLYRLEDYGVLSEVLRSGGPKQKNKDPNNLLLVVLSNNQSRLTRKNMDYHTVDSIPSLRTNTENKYQFSPTKYKNQEKRPSKIEPIMSHVQKKYNVSNEKMKYLIGNALHKKIQQKKKRDRYTNDDVRQTRPNPPTLRLEAAPSNIPKFPKVRGESKQDSNVYPKLKYDYDVYNPKKESKIEPIRSNPVSNLDMYTDNMVEENIKIPAPVETAKSSVIPKMNYDVPEMYRNPNPGKKRKDRFEIEDGRHTHTENTIVNAVNRLRNDANSKNPIVTAAVPSRTEKKVTTIGHLIARNNDNVDTESQTDANINTEPTQTENRVDKQSNAGQENSQPLDLKMGKDYDVVSIEMVGESPTNIKSGKDVVVENADGIHYVQSDFDPSSLESRKNLQKCIGKKALKMCMKSCNSAYKNVCRRLRCSSKAKRILKKECKKSCRKTFKHSSKSDKKNKGSSSSSDSSD